MKCGVLNEMIKERNDDGIIGNYSPSCPNLIPRICYEKKANLYQDRSDVTYYDRVAYLYCWKAHVSRLDYLIG